MSSWRRQKALWWWETNLVQQIHTMILQKYAYFGENDSTAD